jgi:hypothetical protein
MYATPCARLLIAMPSVRNDLQDCGNVRNNCFVDLEIRCSIRLSYGRYFIGKSALAGVT